MYKSYKKVFGIGKTQADCRFERLFGVNGMRVSVDEKGIVKIKDRRDGWSFAYPLS